MTYPKRGDKGAAVKALQQALIRWHSKSILPQFGADGSFGQETTDGIKLIQYLNKLPQTGIIDDKLWQIINPQKPMDKITAARIQLLHPKIRQEVTDCVNEANRQLTGGVEVRIVQGLRTFKEQEALYAQGRTKPGPVVTNAKAGSSFHNYGLAVDFCLLVGGSEVSWDTKKDLDQDGISDWMEVVGIFKGKGFKWGGEFKTLKDMPHFEKSFGYSVKQLMDKVAKKQVDAAGYVLL